MTEDRKALIEEMKKVISSNPRYQIFPALLANVAEDYSCKPTKIKGTRINELKSKLFQNIDDLLINEEEKKSINNQVDILIYTCFMTDKSINKMVEQMKMFEQ